MDLKGFLDRPEFREIKRELFIKGNNISIEDFLSQSYFKEASDILVKEMGINAGYSLLCKLKEFFGNEITARNWFYSPLDILNKQRPYDYCNTGKRKEIYDMLIRMENGIFS